MLLTSDYILPTEVTGYARQALADYEINRFTLSQWLPSKPIDDIEYRVNNGQLGLADAASFRAYDAEAAIGRRQGFGRIRGELPPLSWKLRLGEYDRLRLRAPNTTAQGSQAIVDAIYNDVDVTVLSVAARIELARGSALSAGAVSIAEDGVIASVDFGRASAHSNVAPAVLWSTTATATPIADLTAWRFTYRQTNGGTEPGAILTSQAVLANILRSAEVKAFAAANGQVPSIVSRQVLNTILAAYDLPPIVVNDAQINVNGTATRVIPANNVLLLPPPGQTYLGGTFWGTTSESLQPEFGLTGAEPGIVAGTYATQDPVALWTKATAAPLPVLANPNLTFQAVVQ
jgi:Phage major capsid protein E